MTALAASREDFRKDDSILAYPMKATTQVWKGGAVSVNSSGYVGPAIQGDVRVVGVAYESVNNTGSAGAATVRVWRKGAFQFAGTSLSQASVGVKVYVTDDQTVQTSSTSTIQVGVVTEYLSSTSVRVSLTPDV